MVAKPGNILDKVNKPEDLKNLSEEELILLCDDLRRYIIDVVSQHPGHLGANLGVVELSVALHYVFNTPVDKLIWDVGHQAYAHKIITGRKEAFASNRKYQGLSGFPKMDESPYDAFGVGHSSTSISALLGMAVAARMNGDNERQHVAVIGDGSMTAGMVFEAMNHAGVEDANMLVVLNDNGIAIDKNVGALKEYFTDITASRTYNRLKNSVWRMLGGGTKYGKNTRSIVQQFQAAVKGTITRDSNYFESFKFRYFGPVDGHDLPRLIRLFSDLKQIPGNKILHTVTVKGKGFSMAEKEQTQFHSPGIFDRETGEIKKSDCKGLAPKYQVVFGKTIIELAEKNPDIIGVTPAMPTGCSLNMMMAKMPERAFDVGIAEQHAVTFSAGMASSGKLPFCNIYSSFMQRAYDQVIHDVALQNLPVVFCLDRGGLVGEDGPTHHGVFDLAFMRLVPNLTISAPMDEVELRNLMYTAQLEDKGPFVIRYPRGRGVRPDWKQEFTELEVGKGRRLKKGEKLALVSIGHPGNFALQAAQKLEEEGLSVSHYDMRFLKPFDEELMEEVCRDHQHIITVEDGTVIGGLGSAVLDFIADKKYESKVSKLGVPDDFVQHGSLEDLYSECGFDTEHIYRLAKEILH